jgi:citrate lyase subunit gamma (acyl carrier protein)
MEVNMKIVRIASAGTMESSDAYVEVSPGKDTVEVSVESVVEGQFGSQIEKCVREVIEECGVNSAHVIIKDRGALDCTIKARTEAAIMRAGGEE